MTRRNFSGGTVGTILREQSVRTPEAIALAAPGRLPLTFAGLQVQVEAAAEVLGKLGGGGAGRIAIAMPTGAERLVVQLAAMSSCTAAPVNPNLLPEELSLQYARLQPKAVVVSTAGSAASRRAADSQRIPCVTADAVAGAPAGTLQFASIPSAPGGGSLEQVEEIGSDSVALLMQTSGTTASPRIVPLTHANVRAGVANVTSALALGPNDRLFSVLQLHHIAGITYPLASLVAGGSVFCTTGFDAEAFYPWMAEADPTWFWVAPVMLHELVRRATGSPELIRPSRLRFIRVGSAPLPVSLMSQAEELFRIPVLESYGMTEAAPQITAAPLPPAKRKPGSVGIPVGTQIRIVGDDGTSLPPHATGEIVIRGASVTSGYCDERRVDSELFLGDWLRTGDLGYLDAGGYLFLTGRVKELINRGGEKISPFEIESVLSGHPGVERAVAFPVSHPTLGEEVAAAVILRPGCTDGERELQKYALGHLSAAKIPRAIYVVHDFPADARGKVRRLALAEQLGVAGGRTPGTGKHKHAVVPPRTPVERSLTGMWEDVLRLDKGLVGTNIHFLDLGGDSLSAAQIISRVRRMFNIDLSPLVFFEAPTIAALARIVESMLSTPGNQPR